MRITTIFYTKEYLKLGRIIPRSDNYNFNAWI